METVTVSSKFRVVIPRVIREKMGLKPGHKLQAVAYNNRIELIPVRPIREMRGFLKGITTDLKREADRGLTMDLTYFSPKTEKRGSGIEGRGLFAKEAISEGEIIVVKGGYVMTRAQRDHVEEHLGPAEIQITEELFIGPPPQMSARAA